MLIIGLEMLIKEYNQIIRNNKRYMSGEPNVKQKKVDRDFIKNNHSDFGKGIHNEGCSNSIYENSFMDFLWDYEEYLQDSSEYMSLKDFEDKCIESFIEYNSYSGD
jgi:hypothetical protein